MFNFVVHKTPSSGDLFFTVNVFASGAATLLLSDTGQLYACGENNDNRLGLDIPGLFGSTVIEKALVPTKVKINNTIIDVAMSPNHTICLTEQGKVITMGQNTDAQLGRGHSKSNRGKPEMVKVMEDKEVTLIAAGSSFTIVGTNENVLYFWGTRYASPYTTRPNTRDLFSQSFGSRMATPSDTPLSESDLHSMMNLESMRKEMSSGHHKQLLLDASLAAKKEAYEKTIATLSSTALLKHQGDITLKDVILAPQEILALFASTKQQEKGNLSHSRNVCCRVKINVSS